MTLESFLNCNSNQPFFLIDYYYYQFQQQQQKKLGYPTNAQMRKRRKNAKNK